jgi:hypothetical protein
LSSGSPAATFRQATTSAATKKTVTKKTGGTFEFKFYSKPAERRCLKFYGIEWGDPEAVTRLVQDFLRRFRLRASFGLSWCASCSEMGDVEIGGGAIIVTAERIEAWSTGEWLAERQRVILEQVGSACSTD